MRVAARRGVYSNYAQKNLIQAQYFRDPNRLSDYYRTNDFLTRVNGEVSEKRDPAFKANLETLNELVLIMFSRDTTVVPRESSWFGSISPPVDQERWGEPGELLPMRLQPLYTHNWIGLKTVSLGLSRFIHVFGVLLEQSLIQLALCPPKSRSSILLDSGTMLHRLSHATICHLILFSSCSSTNPAV